jgi:hypothetical protein
MCLQHGFVKVSVFTDCRLFYYCDLPWRKIVSEIDYFFFETRAGPVRYKREWLCHSKRCPMVW